MLAKDAVLRPPASLLPSIPGSHPAALATLGEIGVGRLSDRLRVFVGYRHVKCFRLVYFWKSVVRWFAAAAAFLPYPVFVCCALPVALSVLLFPGSAVGAFYAPPPAADIAACRHRVPRPNGGGRRGGPRPCASSPPPCGRALSRSFGQGRAVAPQAGLALFSPSGQGAKPAAVGSGFCPRQRDVGRYAPSVLPPARRAKCHPRLRVRVSSATAGFDMIIFRLPLKTLRFDIPAPDPRGSRFQRVPRCDNHISHHEVRLCDYWLIGAASRATLGPSLLALWA